MPQNGCNNRLSKRSYQLGRAPFSRTAWAIIESASWYKTVASKLSMVSATWVKYCALRSAIADWLVCCATNSPSSWCNLAVPSRFDGDGFDHGHTQDFALVHLHQSPHRVKPRHRIKLSATIMGKPSCLSSSSIRKLKRKFVASATRDNAIKRFHPPVDRAIPHGWLAHQDWWCANYKYRVNLR